MDDRRARRLPLEFETIPSDETDMAPAPEDEDWPGPARASQAAPESSFSLERSGESVGPPTSPSSDRPRLPASAIGLLLLLTAVFGYVAWRQIAGPPDPTGRVVVTTERASIPIP